MSVLNAFRHVRDRKKIVSCCEREAGTEAPNVQEQALEAYKVVRRRGPQISQGVNRGNGEVFSLTRLMTALTEENSWYSFSLKT
jgi:hypothetical protein